MFLPLKKDNRILYDSMTTIKEDMPPPKFRFSFLKELGILEHYIRFPFQINAVLLKQPCEKI